MTGAVEPTVFAILEAAISAVAREVAAELRDNPPIERSSAGEGLPAVFDSKGAAAFLNVGVNTIGALVNEGELEAFTIRDGKRRFISRAACERFIERQEAAARLRRDVVRRRAS